MKHLLHQAACCLLVVFFTFGPALASAQGLDEPACRSLADLRITDTNLLSAVVVPESDDLPEYCSVIGYVLPAINFEIRLPTSDWNGKFYMTGCGVGCGKVEADQGGINSSNHGLKRNYAVASMDSGHWGDWRGYSWAYHNRQAEIDWGHRAVHETARVTKDIIEAFYGRQQEHAYFQGCSTGGRMANMAAYRYPEDFDGIISEAPGLDQTGANGIYNSWLVTANTGTDGQAIIASAALKRITDAVYAVCDEVDGLKDGLIDDPRQCSFDPQTLACSNNSDSDCLTSEQVETLRTWYSKPTNSDREPLYPSGLPLGSEANLGRWLLGSSDEMSNGFLKNLVEQFYRYMAFEEDPGASYSVMDFDLDKDPPRLAFMGSIINSDQPDLEAFRARGGKLLMWHGWADAAIPPLKTISYYDAVEEHVGSREETGDFLRLFMIPGMGHCGLGDGPGIDAGGIDPLSALERWVEDDVAPDHLITTKRDENGDVMWTRPVCPYPQRAVYNGEGDVTDASSFDCVEDH